MFPQLVMGDTGRTVHYSCEGLAGMTTHNNDLYAAIAAQVTQYAHVDATDDVIETMLTALTTGLVDAVPAALFATITLVEDGNVVSVASTDPIAERIDELQAKHDIGPCLMAAWTQTHVVIDDYDAETRWQLFTEDVTAQTPVRSSASFPLYREGASMGALNIHADQTHVFDDATITMGSTFATQAALALHADTRQQQFDAALSSRDVIGQAKGMLMQEYKVDANAAFEMIRRISQDSNTKLVDLARRIVASAHDAT